MTFTSISTLDRIGSSAFEGCNKLIGGLELPRSLRLIEDSAFEGCSELNGSLTFLSPFSALDKIGSNAFKGCNKLSGALVLPLGLSLIGDNAFNGCNGLTSITYGGPTTTTQNTFSGYNGNLIQLVWFTFIQNKTVITGIRPAGASAIGTFPEIPSNVIKIDNLAFENCSKLTGSLIIPEGVTSIGNSAFSGCTGLTGNLTIPPNVTTIGNNAFQGCVGFNNELIFTSPSTITTIAPSAFTGCINLIGSIVIPPTVTTIGANAFKDCTKIKSFTYYTTATIDPTSFPPKKSVIKLLWFTFNQTKTTITGIIPPGASAIGAFPIVPSTVTAIADNAFAGCTKLTGSVVIPPNVTTIGANAFKDCTKMKSFSYYSTTTINSTSFPPKKPVIKLNSFIFNQTKTTITGILPAGSSAIGVFPTIPSTVTAIADNAFAGCVNITGAIIIPQNVTTVGVNAFKDCTKIKGFTYYATTTIDSTTFPPKKSVKKLNAFTFNETKTTIIGIVPSGINAIGAFPTIPPNVTTIGAAAFSGCSKLTGSITIPKTVKTIGANAFKDCKGLTITFYKLSTTTIDPTSFFGTKKVNMRMKLVGFVNGRLLF